MYNPQLATFIKVADVGSFSKAAVELYITPTAVIKQINSLEKELNLQLFVRTHRGLTLTPEGKSLYKDAKYLISYAKKALARARNARVKAQDIIRIGVSPMTPAQFLLDLFPQIHKQYPQLKFELVPYENSRENAKEILNNMGKNIDLVAGLYDEDYLKYYNCSALTLENAPLVCAMSIHHELAEKEILTMEDLFGEDVLLIHQGWNKHMDELRYDIEKNYPEINLIDFDLYRVAVFNRCENDNSILIVTDLFKNVHPLLKFIPVDWKYTIPFGLFHAQKPSPNVQLVLDMVNKIINK